MRYCYFCEYFDDTLYKKFEFFDDTFCNFVEYFDNAGPFYFLKTCIYHKS